MCLLQREIACMSWKFSASDASISTMYSTMSLLSVVMTVVGVESRAVS